MISTAFAHRSASDARPAHRSARWLEWAVVTLAFAIQVPLVLNPDLGWLLTVCEKMLAGGRLGIDVIELNPPLSVLMYMPAAWLGTLTPVPAHIFVIIMGLLLAWGSCRLTVRVLSPLCPGEEARQRVFLILLAISILLPGATFGQREHFAVLGLLPFIAHAASLARSRGVPTGTRDTLLIGLCGGLAMCIKPHFALPIALPLFWAAPRQRSVRPIFDPTCWIAGAVVVLYYGAAFLTYPEYFSVYPRWAALSYLPLRVPSDYFYNFAALLTGAALGWMLWLACRRDRTEWLQAVPWLLAALGGFCSYVLQGKDFSYARLAATSFAMLAAMLSSSVVNNTLSFWDKRKMVLASLAPIFWLIPAANDFTSLEAPIRVAAPTRPKMLAVASNVGLGEPLVRRLDGEWASAAGSQLLSAGASFRLDNGELDHNDRVLAKQIIAMERTRLREDLQQRRPDVLLIDSQRFGWRYDWEAWARTDPAIDDELNRHYRLLERMQGVAIWLRRPAGLR